MTDIVEVSSGLALDMNQSRPIEGVPGTRVVGSNGYEETAGSDVVVITAGVPRKPGMSRMDLLETNAKIVGEVTRKVADASPDAVLIVVSNPLDEMTALAAEVSGFARERVKGQAGMLDTARFKHFLSEELGTSPDRVEAMTLGSHGDTMVPVPSMVRVDGKPLTEVADAGTIERLVQRTRDGAAEVVALLKPGSAYYALERGRGHGGAVRGHRRDHAGLRLGHRPVRYRRRLPGRPGPAGPRRGGRGGRAAPDLRRAGRPARGRRGRPLQAGRRGQAGWLSRPGSGGPQETGGRGRRCRARELCAARPLTPWFHADDRCWVAECLICRTPMVVWRRHGADPPPAEREHMLARLSEVAAARLGDGAYRIDPVMWPDPRPPSRPRPRSRLARVRPS